MMVLMNAKLRLLFISNGIQVFGATLLVPVFALFIADIGGGPELAGILFGISFVTTAFVNLFVMRIEDRRLLDATLYKIGMAIKICAWVMLALVQSIPVLIAAQVILGVAASIGSPAFGALVSENLDKKRHISDWARWDFSMNLATGLASAVSGFIVVHLGFPVLFAVMALVTAMALFLAMGLIRGRRYARR